MYFSMKQYPAVCDDIAYDVNSDKEVARVDDLLVSSEEVCAALDDKQRGTDCKPEVLLTPHFIRKWAIYEIGRGHCKKFRGWVAIRISYAY